MEDVRTGHGASVRDLHGHEHVAAAILLPVPPFDFARSARIAAAGDPRVRRYEGGRFWQALQLGPHLALAMLHMDGGPDDPHLYVELRSVGRLTVADLGRAREQLTRLFRLDLDLAPFEATALGDPVMASLVHRLHGLHPTGAPTVFEDLVLALVDHRLWTPAAPGTVASRLVQDYGERIELCDGAHLAFPSAGALALAGEEDLRAAGLTRARVRAIRGLARAVAEGLVDLEACADVDGCSAALHAAGFGQWADELAAVRDVRRLDVAPAGDPVLGRAVSHYYFGGRPVGEAQVRGVAARWGGWAGLAAHYLVVAWRDRLEAAGERAGH